MVILMALGLAWALTRLAGGACARMANRCDTEMCGCVERGAARIEASASRADEYFKRISKRAGENFMMISFLPMLLTGMFLGLLVVVGQGSKQGFMQVVTAVVLMADVIFKVIRTIIAGIWVAFFQECQQRPCKQVGATVLTELLELTLHRRVTRAVAARGEKLGPAPGPPVAARPGARGKAEETDCPVSSV